MGRRAPCSSLLFFVAACGGGSDGDSPGASPPPPPVDVTQPPPATADPCPHLTGGAAGTHAPLVDFARGAGAYRFFGPGADAAPGEHAIAAALANGSAVTDATVTTFATGLDGACAIAAEARPLGAASVTSNAGIAVVKPGTGDIALPPDATSVAIDLRDLPESPDLASALARAFAAVAHTAPKGPTARVRECNGQPDEVYSVLAQTPNNAYACNSLDVPGDTLAASAAADLPLAIFTGHTIAPSAARFAVSLRAQRRAWLLGEDVPAAAAEVDWYGVGQKGIAVRTRTLLVSGKKIPDVVSADVRSSDPLETWTTSPPQGEPLALSGDAKRADFDPRPVPTTARAASDAPGDARAALIVAYATAHTYWPYVDELMAPIDDRLVEAMALVDAGGGRLGTRRAIQRFSEALSDGHSFVVDFSAKSGGTVAPIAVEPVGNDIVVALSTTPTVLAGETILAIDGSPIATELSHIEQYIACSPHEKATFAAQSLFSGRPSATVHVRAGDGSERDVTLTGVTQGPDTFSMWDRAPGTLADLGAADIYYVSLTSFGPYAASKASMTDIDAGLAAARAVVLDMRGYPEAASWKILAKVIPQTARGPLLSLLDVTPIATKLVPDDPQVLSIWSKGPATPFTGPVVMLVGPHTQSQAEHLTSFYKDSKRGKVIGGQTSGANGNITGIQLPGGYGITFTGMHVAHTDGSKFFGIGHIPDIAVEPAITDYRDHRDAVLLRAITELAP
jgi:hypothetical protein